MRLMDSYTKYALRDIEKSLIVFNFIKTLPFRWEYSTGAPFTIQRTEPGYWWWLLNVAIIAFASFSTCMFLISIIQGGWDTPTQVQLVVIFPVFCTALVGLHLPIAVI